MRNIILIAISCLVFNCYGQKVTQGIKVRVEEKTKEGSRVLVLPNTKIEITLNDTVKITATSNEEGYVGPIPTNIGKHNVKGIREGCEPAETRGIIVGENKTCYITLEFICDSYINSLSKKERKKLGYK